MRRPRRWWVTAALFAVPLGGCINLGTTSEEVTTTVNRCETDDDCAAGTCLSSRLCSVAETEFSALLLELTPPSTQERFQGALTYYPLRLDRRPSADYSVTVKYPRAVRGDIGLAFGAADCRPSPVVVTFVPVEARLGIDTPRYSTISEVGTAIIDKKHVDTHKYALSGIPEGTYDVYLEDANLVDNSARPECAVAPQSIRALSITSQEGASKFVRNLVQSRARSLRVVVPSGSPFEGWTTDVIHRVTGELLSSRAILPVSTPDANSVAVTLRLSEVMGEDSDQSGVELLRLSPPNTEGAPTITLVLAGLEVFERGEALVPSVGSLASSVAYQAWVWQSAQGGGVRGRVQFTAQQLDALPPGVNATFERRATIGSSGLVRAELPPGRYLAQVFPDAITELAQHEAEVNVWLPVDEAGPGTSQGGHLILVPRASTLRGRVTFGAQPPPPGTQVLAVGSRHGSAGFPGAVALVDGDRFSLSGLACRACGEGGPGATYDVFVRPALPSGLPWVIATDKQVNSLAVELADLDIQVPRVATGLLSVTTNGAVVPLPRFSVRAYSLLDKAGRPLSDVNAPRCDELSTADAAFVPCAAQVLEVASTRTNDDGSFTLLLPQALLRPPAVDGGL